MFGIEQAFAATADENALVASFIGGGAMVLYLVSIALLVLLIIARWKLFTKAGEAGWKSIIPFYSDYVQWRIGWKNTKLFWVYLALVVIGFIVMTASGSYRVSAAGNMAYMGGGNSALAGIGSLAVLVGFILALIAAYKLICAYGHGVGWFILYLLFPSIMLLVLGFGSSRYEGPQD